METLSTEATAAVADLAALLRSRRVLAEQDRWQLNHDYRRKALNVMLETGATYGEATGAPGTVSPTRDAEEFKRQLRAIDDDLTNQVRVLNEGVGAYFAHGEWPAPYFAWRIGIILRKAKQPTLEAEFLEAWSVHFRNGPGARYQAVAKRAIKARQLASRSR